MKKVTILRLFFMLIFTLVACSSDTADLVNAMDIAQPASASSETSETTVSNQQPTIATAVPVTVEFKDEDLETSENSADLTIITLDGNAINIEGEGAVVNGNNLTVTAAGTYLISGKLDDGQIIVDTQDAENVTLILDNVKIASSNSAPIYFANAEKVILTLAAGSQNIVTDGNTYTNLDEGGEPNAAIFSKDDLTINGEGALTVNANYNNGIASKDDLKITSGAITANAG